jgi:hypothetical protein
MMPGRARARSRLGSARRSDHTVEATRRAISPRLSSVGEQGADVLVAAEALGGADVAAVEVEHGGDGAVADAVGPGLDLDPVAEPTQLPLDGGGAQALGVHQLPLGQPR